MRTLIIVNSKKKYFWPWVDKLDSIQVEEAYKRTFDFSFMKKLKKKSGKYHFTKLGILGNWVKKANDYDQIIFLDSSYSKQFDRIIERLVKKENKKIVFFYWNKIHLNENIARQQISSISKNMEIWSYNKNDCKKYGLKYNTTMYTLPPNYRNKNIKINQAVFFGGYFTNERVQLFDEVLDQLKKMGITYYIDAARSGIIENEPRNFELKEECLGYEAYLEEIKRSNAVLNLDKYPDMGCSLRALEALNCKKKYITNNIDVLTEKFYNQENIFVIGKDDLKELKKFLNSPYKEVEEYIINYYSLNEWAKRFSM